MNRTPVSATVVPAVRRIPRIIHQIWMQGIEQVPSRFTVFRRAWSTTHPAPAWRLMFWDECRITRLVAQHYPQWLEMYTSMPLLIQRADAARAFILHHHGGVYADMDSMPLQSFDAVLDELHAAVGGRHVVALGRTVIGARMAAITGALVDNSIILSTAGHPFWQESFLPRVDVALKYGRRGFGRVSMVAYVFNTTGPAVYGRIIADRGCSHAVLRMDLGHTAAVPAKVGDGATSGGGGVVVVMPFVRFNSGQDLKGEYGLSDEDRRKLVASGAYSFHASATSWLSGNWEKIPLAIYRSFMKQR